MAQKKTHTRSLGHKTIHYCLHCTYKSIGIFALRLQTVVALLLLVGCGFLASAARCPYSGIIQNPLDSRHFLFLLRLDALGDLFLSPFCWDCCFPAFPSYCDCFFFHLLHDGGSRSFQTKIEQ